MGDLFIKLSISCLGIMAIMVCLGVLFPAIGIVGGIIFFTAAILSVIFIVIAFIIEW